VSFQRVLIVVESRRGSAQTSIRFGGLVTRARSARTLESKVEDQLQRFSERPLEDG
jgi:hypothetical protein